jgi:endo-1,4-beta-xylanase
MYKKQFSDTQSLLHVMTLIIGIALVFAFISCEQPFAGTDTAITFSSVTADGSSSQTTTQLTLTFNAVITGLSAADITLTGVSGVSKGSLSGSGLTYTLPVSGFTSGGSLSVAVAKTGYAFSGSPKTVTIFYYSGAGNTPVTFSGLSANGSSSQTTTQLTLTFSAAITGLSAADITLTGVSGVSKGTLSGSGPSYTLPISGFTSGGTLTVAAAKTGYAVSGSPRTVTIYSASGGGNQNPLYLSWPFYVGAAAPGSAFTTSNGQYPLLKHFNVLVAENDMKPVSVMPSQWQNSQSNPVYNASQAYRWTEADKLVNYAKANNTKIRGHVLFWHEQIPNVFFTTGNASASLITKEVLYQRIEQHAKTVFQKYGGDILWWDVANECVGDDGNPRTTGNANIAGSNGTSGFTAVMTNAGVTGDARYDWIVEAFKYARQYADANGGQNVKLFLTEYGIEESTTKLDGLLRLVDYLISKGAPIDGVGIQGHARIGTGNGNSYVNGLSDAIDQITKRKNPVNQNNLVVQVCELDISLFAWNDSTLTLSGSELNSRLTAQAAMYRNLFDMFAVKYSEGRLDMVLVWGLADGESWLNVFPTAGREDHPLLFDRQYQPKAAFNALINESGGGGETEETVLGSFNANAGNPHINLSSTADYQIVNLTGENRINVMKVTNPDDWAVALYNLAAYKNTQITITFSADIKRVGAAGDLYWQINNGDYPSVGTPINNAEAGTWHTMSGTWTGIPTSDYPYFYLSTYYNNSDSTTYYIDNFEITITPQS